MQSSHDNPYDVLIIGGGASGTALLYTLATYTNIKHIALVEKYDKLAQVNSNSKSNSQSLHIGDIEMHYTRKKAAEVKPGALMVPRYLEDLPQDEQDNIMTRVQKMALAVGEDEVAEMEDRWKEFEGLFPTQQRLERDAIAKVEPKIVEGRDPREPILALYDEDGHAVDYQALSESFVQEAEKTDTNIDLHLGTSVSKLIKTDAGYEVQTHKGTLYARTVVVDADSYSLGFAKSLGYGKEYSMVPVGASFYFTQEVLKGKVYPMQDRKLPFAGVHGDPDVGVPGKTRWGPTAKFLPVLESDKWHTTPDYFKAAGLGRWSAIKSLLKVVLDPTRFLYFLKSAAYDIPWIGKRLFVKNVQKIVPTIKAKDLKLAKGVGGMRLQRINVTTGELELGEGKIVGDNIIFNMTPSPGASVCLHNGLRDARELIQFFGSEFHFDEARMRSDLIA